MQDMTTGEYMSALLTIELRKALQGGVAWADTSSGVNASAGGYFYLDHTGGQRTFNIQQLSTLDNDWLKIISISGTAASTVCVVQNDQGTSTSC